jgi:hypothetical protein
MDWDFGHLPHIDRDAAAVLGERYTEEKNWIPGPIKWVRGTCYAMGSEDGKDRREEIAVRPKDGLEVLDDPLQDPEEGAGIDSVVNSPTTADVTNEGAIKKDDEVERSVPETVDITNDEVAKKEETVEEESHPVAETAVPKEEPPLQQFATAHEGTTPGEPSKHQELEPVPAQEEPIADKGIETPQTQPSASIENPTPTPSNDTTPPHAELIEENKAEVHPETGLPVHPNGMVHKAFHFGNGLIHPPHHHHHIDRVHEVNGSV